jgi:hypothetical protein
MTPWVCTVTNVLNTSGVITQLYPDFVAAGVDTTTAGSVVRMPTDGVLLECSVYPFQNFGGILELWDVAGNLTGSPNVNSGSTLTNATLTELIAQGKAKKIWEQSFKADAGLTTKKFTQRVPVMFGLAARIIDNTGGGGAGTQSYKLNIVAGGCYRVVERLG